MNDNDMANMIKKAQEMIKNNQVPDELKNIVANMQNNNLSNSNNASNNMYNNNNYNKYSSTYSQRNNQMNNNYNHSNNANINNKYNQSNGANNNNNNTNFDINKLGDLLKNFQSNNSNSENHESSPQIDMETILKLQNVMSKMKSFNSNDDMSQLLNSLKPYLRNEKKEKVDEYIKLIKMGKMTQAFDLFGGDKS